MKTQPATATPRDISDIVDLDAMAINEIAFQFLELDDLERRLLATLYAIWRLQNKRKKVVNLAKS